MRAKIDVLKTDVKLGACNDPYNCAVARATRRSLKHLGCNHVAVGNNDMTVHMRDGSTHSVSLPKKVANFIVGFDDRVITPANFKPLSFQINL